MENVLIIDTETTGLHPEKGAQLIEIGAILYNVKHREILQNFSTLLPCSENPVEHINNIKASWTMCRMDKGLSSILNVMVDSSNAIVAHNAEFDKKFLRLCTSLTAEFWSNTWICTQKQFKWPANLYRHRLEDVCNAMGVPYVNAHRALSDCTFIAKCFSKVENLEERLIAAARVEFGVEKNYI